MQINERLLRKNAKGEHLQSKGNIVLNNIIGDLQKGDLLRVAGRPSSYINPYKTTPSSDIVKNQLLQQ
jgi:hypothetical protein